MPFYQTPGVYVEEISTGTKPIEAVGTSTVGFVGSAPDPIAHRNKAIAISNWSQFVKEFAPDGSDSTPLALAVYGFYQNASGLCYVVNIGNEKTLTGEGHDKKGIDLLAEIDEIAIVVAPGFTDVVSYEALLSHCENLGDRFAILDPQNKIPRLNMLTKVATAKKTKSEDTKPANSNTDEGLRPRVSDKGYGAFYFPRILMADPFDPEKVISAPPSGHLAGIYARGDATRGVHKAPANEQIRGAVGLTYRVTREEQGELNAAGVNCIRIFPRQGIRVWGARTLADKSSEYKYINVRRLINMIKESIEEGTNWVVFEPNDKMLWQAISRDVRSFLSLLWRQGALKGNTPGEAFFVKCDEETNPPESIDAGMVVTVIGVAPVKPAEFVIFRIGLNAETSQTEAK